MRSDEGCSSWWTLETFPEGNIEGGLEARLLGRETQAEDISYRDRYPSPPFCPTHRKPSLLSKYLLCHERTDFLLSVLLIVQTHWHECLHSGIAAISLLTLPQFIRQVILPNTMTKHTIPWRCGNLHFAVGNNSISSRVSVAPGGCPLLFCSPLPQRECQGVCMRFFSHKSYHRQQNVHQESIKLTKCWVEGLKDFLSFFFLNNSIPILSD